jgi:hypothetical protein
MLTKKARKVAKRHADIRLYESLQATYRHEHLTVRIARLKNFVYGTTCLMDDAVLQGYVNQYSYEVYEGGLPPRADVDAKTAFIYLCACEPMLLEDRVELAAVAIRAVQAIEGVDKSLPHVPSLIRPNAQGHHVYDRLQAFPMSRLYGKRITWYHRWVRPPDDILYFVAAVAAGSLASVVAVACAMHSRRPKTRRGKRASKCVARLRRQGKI